MNYFYPLLDVVGDIKDEAIVRIVWPSQFQLVEMDWDHVCFHLMIKKVMLLMVIFLMLLMIMIVMFMNAMSHMMARLMMVLVILPSTAQYSQVQPSTAQYSKVQPTKAQ